MKINKVVRIGSSKTYGGRHFSTYCKIKFDGKKLSITGVEGPLRSGNCFGGAGQIVGNINIETFAPGWNQEKLNKFQKLWKRWHLNNMMPGCEHQRAEKWNKRPIDPNKPLNSYGKHFEGQKYDSYNMLAWVTRKEHPKGLLSEPCPVCGYKYGSAWLFEEVPQEVLEFLNNLPETDKTPAWV